MNEDELERRANAGPEEFVSADEVLAELDARIEARRTGNNVDKIFLGAVMVDDRRQDDRRS